MVRIEEVSRMKPDSDEEGRETTPPNTSGAEAGASITDAATQESPSSLANQQSLTHPEEPSGMACSVGSPSTTMSTHQWDAAASGGSSHDGQPQFKRVKIDDALAYLELVKSTVTYQPQLYNEFLDLMKAFKAQSIDTARVISYISSLFRDHVELIVGFNAFLPHGCKVEVLPGDQMMVTMPSQTRVVPIPTGYPHRHHIQLPVVAATPPELVGRTAHLVHNAPVRPSLTISPETSPQVHPTEFNLAIHFVNKIKSRLRGQPDKYRQFLDVLHTYQKDQGKLKQGAASALRRQHIMSEAEVYRKVAKLFDNQEDLLQEFVEFLPDASSYMAFYGQSFKGTAANKPAVTVAKLPVLPRASAMEKSRMTSTSVMSMAESGKHGSSLDRTFFDKVRHALKYPNPFDNFLKYLQLYNQKALSKTELVHMVTPFLGKFPDLFDWFKEVLLRHKSGILHVDTTPTTVVAENEGPYGAMGIDYTTCKRIGASYCALPETYVQPVCSGRTSLCKEALNDTWVSFPSWSESSTFVRSSKMEYEDRVWRCEEDRFELDMMIETNAAAIVSLEAVQKEMSRMTPEEVERFRLDDCLGGTSPTINQRAIRRIYGDNALEVIDALQENPSLAIPVVLRRLKAKDEEWHESQRGFKEDWREQMKKYYLKSLDYQGINFKQTDMKALKSKSLLKEIEALYDERYEQADKGSQVSGGPHLVLDYPNKSVINDASYLILHHVKRLKGILREDKQKMKHLLRLIVPESFLNPRQELGDDEPDGDCDGGKEAKDKCDTPPANDSYMMFMGSNNWYLLLRYHHILCERLTSIYEHALQVAEEEARNRKDLLKSDAVALQLKRGDLPVDEYYNIFLDMVKSVLDRHVDADTYEDTLRQMFGIHAYIAFTLDKVVVNAVLELQHIVNDDTCMRCMEAFLLNRGCHEALYQRRAQKMLAKENSFLIKVYNHKCLITVELLPEWKYPSKEVPNWRSYVERFLTTFPQRLKEVLMMRRPRFLPRNRRSWPTATTADESENESENTPEAADGEEIADHKHCRLSQAIASKVVIVVGSHESHNYMYKLNSLLRAREGHCRLTRRVDAQFRYWHWKWSEANVSLQQHMENEEWMMGRGEDMVPNITSVNGPNDLSRPPYRMYNRYRVKRLPTKEQHKESGSGISDTKSKEGEEEKRCV